jgi:hypothetical protein
MSLNGDIDPPTADANDVVENWCIDDVPDDVDPDLPIRGTPRERNRECEE